MKLKILLSYCKHDLKKVLRIKKKLQRLFFGTGIELEFYDYNNSVLPGEDILDSVLANLASADVIMPFISRAYWKSNWCKKERKAAFRRKDILGEPVTIIPIVIEKGVTEKMPLDIQDLSFVDFTKDKFFAFKQLVSAIQALVKMEKVESHM